MVVPYTLQRKAQHALKIINNMENEPKKKYIITDPCYILNDADYENKLCGYNGTEYPFNSTNKETGQIITIYKNGVTPNGDGSFTYEDQEIGVDSGQLCIAHCKEGWNEEFGAQFHTLYEAKNAFETIIRHF